MTKLREPKRRHWRSWRPNKGPGNCRLFLRNSPTPARWQRLSNRTKVLAVFHDRGRLMGRDSPSRAFWFDPIRARTEWILALRLRQRKNKARLWR